ncbi:MAG: SIMPL domain-containing protein [Hymenobacteraceae bacterium]|nr:SIMPL domain-containing protein [Hymenobacteraceae bacterium]
MKNFIFVLFLIVFAGCQSKPTVEKAKFKTIMIRSVGEAETLPDEATFYINLSCLDKSVKDSKQCLVDKSNALNKKLLAFGINKDDILTTAVNLEKSYTWQKNSRVFEGYNSSTSVFVTVKNIDKLDEIYTELLENSNLQLGGLSYTHSKLDSLKNEAYLDALQKANVLADKLLTGIPENDKEILKIGNVEISASLPETREAKYEADVALQEASVVGSRAIAISKGTVRIQATLFVEYQIR